MVIGWLASVAALVSPAGAQDLDTFALSGGLFDGRGTLQLASPALSQPGAWFLGVGSTWADSPVLAGDTVVIAHQAAARLAAGYTLGERLRLEASLPTYPSVSVAGEAGFALGDARAAAMIGLVGSRSGAVSLGLMPFLSVPTGSEPSFLTAGGLSGGGLVAARAAAGPLALVVNGGVAARPSANLDALAQVAGVAAPDATLGTRAPWGLGITGALGDALLLGAELDGWVDLAGGLEATGAIWEHPAEVHGYGALSLGGLTLSAGAGRGVVASPGVPAWRAFLGLGWRADGEPRMRDGDGDGLADGVDVCPSAPGPVSGGGCPDTDGDGVRDDLDPCPQVAGPDGGCPSVVVDGGRLALRGEVRFVGNKAVLAPDSAALLDEVASLLAATPGLKMVEIEVVATPTADSRVNQALAQERSEVVKVYLVATGVEATRLYTVGYGEARPLAGRPDERVDFVVLSNTDVPVGGG